MKRIRTLQSLEGEFRPEPASSLASEFRFEKQDYLMEVDEETFRRECAQLTLAEREGVGWVRLFRVGANVDRLLCLPKMTSSARSIMKWGALPRFTPSRIAREVGINTSTVWRWRTGKVDRKSVGRGGNLAFLRLAMMADYYEAMAEESSSGGN